MTRISRRSRPDKQIFVDNGRLVRVIVDTYGTTTWYRDGKIHREDGPAMIFDNGTQLWFLDDDPMHFDLWCEKLNLSDELRTYYSLLYK